MTQPYNGILPGSFPDLITGPSPGELVTANSVGNIAQGAANQDLYLYSLLTGTAYTAFLVYFNGRSRRRARVAVTDGNRTLGVAAGSGVDFAGSTFSLVTLPAAPRTLTLKSTGVVPEEGETLEAFWYSTSIGPGVAAFTFQREGGGGPIATFQAAADGIVTDHFCWAEFEFVSGAWVLGRNNGYALDTGGDPFGVVPGSHAA